MTLPVVVIPLYDRPVRAAFTVGREIGGEQLRALAGIVHKHLQELAPIVEILKHAGWEVLAQETALLCRHPSVRTRAVAEVALCQLGVESQWYRIHDTAEWEQLFPTPAENGLVPFLPPSGPNECRDTSQFPLG